ncbi:hypothetical protein K458DRAFT_71008 [Lentithecium fluviatile CBS 122367]|uniref:Uncharacterized protein n=1 Tax=Lentithecium fluviatile CBS 122367 TaxID=1168545 RepID=A0A6G1JML7_9PLEO|nr:hypothetical protein K458DRAFT_71008 [Lentithecium fluviatile CBS 122367]
MIAGRTGSSFASILKSNIRIIAISRLAASLIWTPIGSLPPPRSCNGDSSRTQRGEVSPAMSYKVEELLALRDSVSESAVSLDRFADEEVIKEHVLRPSVSATLAAAASNKSLRLSATPAIAPAAFDKKPSPSPSIKRGKAERLLKEHGSPPGMRVTAGGRVVPSDLPPLNNNRFVNNAFKPPPLRGLAIGNTMGPQQPRSETNSVPRLEVVGSQPVLYVGDRAYALPALEAPGSAMSSSVSGIMEAAAKPAPPPPVLSAQSSFTNAPLAPSRVNTQTPFSGLDLPTLKAQQTLKRQELRTVEQTEVLQASHQTEAWRAGIIEKKRNLIIELDALRKQIAALEATENSIPPAQSNGFTGPAAPAMAPPPPAFTPQFQQAMPSAMYGYPGSASFPPMMMYQPPFSAFPAMPTTEPAPFVPTPAQPAHSPGSASRRSHAIEIKPPREETRKHVSALDPKSPTYEPITKGTAAKGVVPPTPSPAKRSTWRANEESHSDKNEDKAISQKPSLSSIDTTDFFPTNTHEHSSTRIAPKSSETKQASSQAHAVPSTPEKNWPASPWNEGNSSRSSNKAVAKLTSWPEAFGKQPSLPSLKQAATTQERAPPASSEAPQSALTNNAAARKSSEQRSGTDENWSMLHSKPMNHVPSTYQEGYQAGYDHVGIPDSPEVLKGYIQGLLQFLSDESKRGRNNSLRGLVASSTPHDSAISMSFNRADGLVGGQENVRSAKVNAGFDVRKDSAYGPQDGSVTYTLCSEAVHDSRVRNPSMGMYMGQMDSSDKNAFAYRQMLATAENDVGKKNQDKGSMSRADSGLSSNTYPRQLSGNQISSHAYGTPVSMQRYYSNAKEYASKGFSADVPLSARPMTNQRLSGLDGAMDDLSDLVVDTHLNEQPRPATGGPRSTEPVRSTSSAGADASCFRPSSGKGKQKGTSSPTKLAAGDRSDVGASSPTTAPGSPKKSGEHSPAKAKLEQVTNKFRRGKKDDPRNMSPEEKKERSQKWRKRFQALKEREMRDIREYTDNNPRD